MEQLKVFSITDGTLVAKGRVPSILKQAALDAYHHASGIRTRFDHSRIEELIACAQRILSDSKDGVGIPHLYRDEDNEAEKLNDLVNRGSRGKKFVPLWKPYLRDSEGVHSAQIISSYALLQIDRAAVQYLAGNFKRAFTILALATVATADYGFHLGFADRGDVVSGAGHTNSKKSTRMQGASAARTHAISLWHQGPASGGQWRSKLGFAKDAKDEVIAVAAKNGLRMKPDNAIRTIREWIVAETKRV